MCGAVDVQYLVPTSVIDYYTTGSTDVFLRAFHQPRCFYCGTTDIEMSNLSNFRVRRVADVFLISKHARFVSWVVSVRL